MEEHDPVLFLDLNDDLLIPCDDDPVAAVTTGMLFGEKEESMIKLPIIKSEDKEVRNGRSEEWEGGGMGGVRNGRSEGWEGGGMGDMRNGRGEEWEL